MVITSALHAEGPGFDPQMNHDMSWFFFDPSQDYQDLEEEAKFLESLQSSQGHHYGNTSSLLTT